MSLIQTRNILHVNSPYTRLASVMSAGTTTIQVDNTNAMVAGWAMQIGEVGQEQSEVIVGTPVLGGTLINCAATRFDHAADTPVYFTKYDQVVFERSTVGGTLGTASPMTGGTVTYTPDNFYTVFDDTTGSSTYGYRTYFKSTGLNTTTTESDWITFGGLSFYSLGKMRQRIKNKLWDSSYLTDSVIDEWINECKDEMANKVIEVNQDYALGTTNVAFGTDGLGTISDPLFTFARRVWITYDGLNQAASTKMFINDFIPNQIFSAVHPYHAWLGGTVFIVKPSDSSGTASIVYQQFGTTMVNDTDELPVPMRSYSKIFVNYARAEGLLKDGKPGDTQGVAQSIAEFATNITPKDKTGNTTVSLVEPVGGDTFY